jgi:hypothetical protein
MPKEHKYSLTEWSVRADPYSAPELALIYLSGKVVGHPDRPDGREITTSHVVTTIGRNVLTRSGSQITLIGPPAASYAKFCAEAGIVIDDKEPVKIRMLVSNMSGLNTVQ